MAASDKLSRQDTAHLLRRTGFGGSEAEIVAITGMTRRAAINAAMGFPESAASIPAGPDVGVPGFVRNTMQWEAHRDAVTWWFKRMADLANPTSTPSPTPATSAPLPLHEKMTLFWHEHFACAHDKVQDFPELWDQVSMFRRTGLGDFESLVRAVSVHPAMLVYLDNQTNVASGIQENFARELMELHTCGVSAFQEADVVAMSRAWTGHSTVGWNGSRWDATYVYRSADHDHRKKTLFGISANWNGVAKKAGERDTIHELVHGVKRTATARFVTRKLYRYFVHLDPTDAVVNQLANRFIAAGMNIAPLVRAILEHDDFWSAKARYALVKSPTEFVVSLLRRSGLDPTDMGLRHTMAPMGQTLFDPPSVAGWGQGDYWVGTASAWGRGDFAVRQRWDAADAGLLAPIANSSNDAAAAQAILDLFGLEQVSATTRSALRRWHRRTYSESKWAVLHQGFLVGALCPEFHVY